MASAALALPFAPQAAAKPPKIKSRVVTGSAQHVRGSTALLTGLVFPAGTETSCYFQYGTTTAYGSQTPTLAAGNGIAKVPVGQPVSGLTPGLTYHYRLVGVALGKTLLGHDRTFIAGTQGARLVFQIAKTSTVDVFGTPFTIRGVLSGAGNANHPIALQASPFPYLEPFENVGAPSATNATGAFSLRVTNLALSTQFRVVTLDKLPVYSPVVTERVAVHVILHASPTRRKGFVRLYGTVAPAKAGTRILFQLQKSSRPSGKSEITVRFVTVAGTTLKRGSSAFSRFSSVVEISHAGRYRAFVKLGGNGPQVSGASTNVLIRSTVPGRKGKGKGKRKKG
ncbi:MAG TPA: hypothetical protein VES65_09380 [Solirubrobacteraceae bacterium]|nr:hypothetical protein [Solirubrobacteraceae bacterium]